MAKSPAKTGSKEVDAYIAAAPEPHRTTIGKVRAAIRAAAPGLEEGIAWRMPCFKLDGKGLVCYSHFKAHCSFFPMSGTLLDDFADELKSYDLDKGTIRFPPDKPPPASLIRKLVRARIAEAKALGGKRARVKRS